MDEHYQKGGRDKRPVFGLETWQLLNNLFIRSVIDWSRPFHGADPMAEDPVTP